MPEIVLWQCRWLNPGNAKNVTPRMLEWKTVEPTPVRSMESLVQEMRESRFEGKPVYELRGLGVVDGVDSTRGGER